MVYNRGKKYVFYYTNHRGLTYKLTPPPICI